MSGLLNKKKEREKEKSNWCITIGKSKGNIYYYISDSLREQGGNKIKIQLNNYNTKEDKNEYNKIEKNLIEISNEIIPEEIPQLKAQINQNKNQPIYLPSCTSWFNMDSIHEIEKQNLPEFFCGKYPSKTPEIYKEYRNFIINLYRENQNSYLTATVCRRHLAGDACSILRLHAFLEHWGIINFKVDPSIKPLNPFLPKAFNFKSPIYIDASSFLIKEGNANSNKIGNNEVVITNSEGEELRTLYPYNNLPENIFRSFLVKNSKNVLNQINFLNKNYRPKCDICEQLCDLDWYIMNDSSSAATKGLLICDECYNKKELPAGLTQSDFESSNVIDIFNNNNKLHKKIKDKLNDEKWTQAETDKLISLLSQGQEINWEKIATEIGNNKTVTDCVVHLMQLPIKENIQFKVTDMKQKEVDISNKTVSSAIEDQNNPLTNQLIFFAKMFENFVKEDNNNNNEKEEKVELDNTSKLKEIIYKTYSKSIDKSKELKNKEKIEMQKIADMLIYLQMKKIELKMQYFKEFEKMIQFQNHQLKTMESQVIQDRIKLAIKKNELLAVANKLKEAPKYSNTDLTDDVKNIDIKNEKKVLNLVEIKNDNNTIKKSSDNIIDIQLNDN